MSLKSDLPRHNRPMAAATTSPCLTSGRKYPSTSIASMRCRSFVSCNKAPTNPRPAWGINTSSVVEMMNCMGLLSLTLRVNRFAVSSSPFQPQEQALFHTQRHKTVTDSGVSHEAHKHRRPVQGDLRPAVVGGHA